MTHLHRLLFLPAVLAMAAGCTTMGSAANVSHSQFDGARRVSIDPHGLDCGTSMVCGSVGARWSSMVPNAAALVFEVYGSPTSISGAAINVNGQIVELEPIEALTGFRRVESLGMTFSSRAFAVRLDTIRVMAAARRAMVRIVTSDGAVEGIVIDGTNDSKAYHALLRFLSAVDAG